MATALNVCSFNCKNIKTSITELKDLCSNDDFVLLQKTMDYPQWIKNRRFFQVAHLVALQYYG